MEWNGDGMKWSGMEILEKGNVMFFGGNLIK
jgi:hypothetical protein